MIPVKNIELTNRSRLYWFHWTFYLWGFNIQKQLDHMWLLNIFLMYSFELIWPSLAMSDQVKLICYSSKINFISLMILQILSFQESFTIWSVEGILDDNKRLRILLDMEFQYHNNSPFRLFLGKSNKIIF